MNKDITTDPFDGILEDGCGEAIEKDIEEAAWRAKRDHDDEYDFDAKAEEVAKKRGLVVVFPGDNQLQLDFDSEEAYQKFKDRFQMFDLDCKYEEHPSASGLPHRHVTLTFTDKTFTEWQRIAMQAALGSDPVREYLNALRKWHGVENPTRLFEKP